jgi:hypothetical protein
MDPMNRLVTLIGDAIGEEGTPEHMPERAVENITGIPRTTLKRRLVKPADFKWHELEGVARLVGCDTVDSLVATMHGRDAA